MAIIEDVRYVQAAQVETQRGGAMLYEVQVFVKYTAARNTQERWVHVTQLPELLADAQLQSFRWKGKTCLVRWKSTDPDEVIVEAS